MAAETETLNNNTNYIPLYTTPTGAIALRFLGASSLYLCFMGSFFKEYTIAHTHFDLYEFDPATYHLSSLLLAGLSLWISTLVVADKKEKIGLKNAFDEKRSDVISDSLYRVAKEEEAPEGMSWNPVVYFSQSRAINAKVDQLKDKINSNDVTADIRLELAKAAGDLISQPSNQQSNISKLDEKVRTLIPNPK